MSVKPLAGKIAVVPVKSDEVSAGGIILAKAPDAETSIRGKVIAVGIPRIEFGVAIESELKPGDTVVYGTKTQSVSATIDGQDYRLIRESDLWATI